MDGVSDTIKNLFLREVKSERLVVESLDDFSVHAMHIAEEIVTIYLRNEYSLSQQILKKLHTSKAPSKYTK